MSSSSRKSRLVQAAVRKAAQGAKTDRKLLSAFGKVFFDRAPEEDFQNWDEVQLAAVVSSMFDWARDRKRGRHKVRVFNLDPDGAGEEIQHTVIQIVNDDMPFIVDSIAADLGHRGWRIDTLFHPVLDLARTPGGRLTAVRGHGGGKNGAQADSCIHIRLEQILSSGQCAELEKDLSAVLDDVRAATTGWKDMLRRMEEVQASLSGARGAHTQEECAEAGDFLSYLSRNNFTFLGYRSYRFSKDGGIAEVKDSSLGILARRGEIFFPPDSGRKEIEAIAAAPYPVVISKLVGHDATVHRRVPLDAVSVKVLDARGALRGMHLFVGLFTSSTYSCRTQEVPIVRRKVRGVIDRAGFQQGSHDHKALEHILEKMPRDELFLVTPDDLHALVLGILRLQEKHAVALFAHRDPLHRFMSCLVYVPRDSYNTGFRLKAGEVLERALGGKVANYSTTLDDSPLARLLLTIRLESGDGTFDRAEAEAKLSEIGREWDERLQGVLVREYGREKGAALSAVYGRAFPASYHESIEIDNALHDIRQLESLYASPDNIRIDLYRLQDAAEGGLRLKVYHKGAPVSLSDIMPALENMGLYGLSEIPYDVRPAARECPVWIHDFHLQGAGVVDIDEMKEHFEDAFMQVWHGRAENDGFNQLVISARLAWHEVRVFRAYAGFLRQARFPYSREYMQKVLSAHPGIVRDLIALFRALHDPRRGKDAGKAAARIAARIDGRLQKVSKLDHDRILRAFKGLVEKTLRTNYWQRDGNEPKPCFAVKLDSSRIEGLPLPRPAVEIYVYSARMEGVHLRGGKIARGGIRWSDRPDDLRTEILGLMKAQTVKNSVIVPVGAKGGFVVKTPPAAGGKEARLQEGIACYRIFIRSLLDLTDNNVKGRIVRPKNVVCHDGPDPYLVVAADKGTAAFSDIANAISCEAGFWLGDAFASGGSAGYDHKAMGITARGAWESVRRHFREMGRDIQKEPFDVVGVGDMGGDVFGNGMLLSRQIRLVAAFNHLHIFCDPSPDPATSFAERQRLFRAQGGWDAYDTAKLSPGGAVFDRSAKSLALSPQIRKRLGIGKKRVTPDELIQAILLAEADLLWFGGIGVFVKSARESHADADDKQNDSLRVDARDLRAKVVGEGANLAVTQPARVEFARRGGRINTDFIDNSAGVDCSDHEVNIKILLSGVMADGKMTLAQRNRLLGKMTGEVAALVLNDNYEQNQCLSLQEATAVEDLPVHADFIRQLEKEEHIRRHLEGLPDDEFLARLARDRQGLSRPELCILTSWAKISLLRKVDETALPDDPALENLLFSYFPEELRKYADAVRGHKLRRQIVGTQAVNIMVNRMGAVFVMSRMRKTGASEEEVIKAFYIVARVFGLFDIWDSIESLDGKVAASVQLAALREVFGMCKRSVTWLLRFGGEKLDIGTEVAAFTPGIEAMKRHVRGVLSPGVRAAVKEREEKLLARGVPAPLAADLAVLRLLSSALDIINIARRTKADVRTISSAYFIVGEKMHIDWVRAQAQAMTPPNTWQARVLASLMDDYYAYQAALTSMIVKAAGKGIKDWRAEVGRWIDKHHIAIARFERTIGEIRAQPSAELEMLVLAGQRMGQVINRLQ